MVRHIATVTVLLMVAAAAFYGSFMLNDASNLESFAAIVETRAVVETSSPSTPTPVSSERPIATVPRKQEIAIGFDGDLSLGASQGGRSILAALELVAARVNSQRGLLGRPVRILARDHAGVAARGQANLEELHGLGAIAIFSSVHSPVALSEIDFVHEKRVPFLIPWAAATPIVKNGHKPNFVFRLSVRDEFAGEFLVREALKQTRRVALFLENTGWGRSNEKSMTVALDGRGLQPTTVEWFNWGDREFAVSLQRAADSGAEAILMVANPPEGAALLRGMAAREERLPIYSHWGITAGNFGQTHADVVAEVDLWFLQTALGDADERQKLYREYETRLGRPIPADVDLAPVGFANAYDLMNILIRAVEQCGSTDPESVRVALESVQTHDGLIKTYAPPFSATWHEALGIEDFILCRFGHNGKIQPR